MPKAMTGSKPASVAYGPLTGPYLPNLRITRKRRPATAAAQPGAGPPVRVVGRPVAAYWRGLLVVGGRADSEGLELTGDLVPDQLIRTSVAALVLALDRPGDVVGDLEAGVGLSGPERRLVAPGLDDLLDHVPNRVAQHRFLPVDLERRGDHEQRDRPDDEIAASPRIEGEVPGLVRERVDMRQAHTRGREVIRPI
jgi:hypothetical protein